MGRFDGAAEAAGGEAEDAVVELWMSRWTLQNERGGWMATEYLQFAGALVFFVGILIGSYWFVYVPGGRGDRTKNDDA